MSLPRVLFSIPTRHHVEIALDELDGLRELGYNCSSFPYAAKEGVISKAGKLKVLLANAFTLIRTAKKFKPDVIYFNSRVEAIAGARDFITISLLKTFYRRPVKIIIKSHGSDLDIFRSKKFFISRVMIPYLRRNVAGWLFLSSEETKRVSYEGYLPENRLFVAKNIVRADHFTRDSTFKDRMHIPADHKTLLFVGRLIPEKGVYDVIEAFARIKDNFKVTLLIVGWGPEEDYLKKFASDLRLGEQIIFTGFVPEKNMVDYYANCDILVFPTYFPEGFPMALFNSVAAGLPVVTTRTRAAADYLSEPENCIWAEAKNPVSVASAVQRLLTSDDLTANMRQNNIVKGKSFSREQVSRELAEIIQKITTY